MHKALGVAIVDVCRRVLVLLMVCQWHAKQHLLSSGWVSCLFHCITIDIPLMLLLAYWYMYGFLGIRIPTKRLINQSRYHRSYPLIIIISHCCMSCMWENHHITTLYSFLPILCGPTPGSPRGCAAVDFEAQVFFGVFGQHAAPGWDELENWWRKKNGSPIGILGQARACWWV